MEHPDELDGQINRIYNLLLESEKIPGQPVRVTAVLEQELDVLVRRRCGNSHQ